MSEEAPPSLDPIPVEHNFKCGRCGALLHFAPGQQALTCSYCGFVNPIAPERGSVVELNLDEWLNKLGGEQGTVERLVVKCPSCSAETEARPNIVAQKCPFCGAAIVAPARSARLMKPMSLLPFRIEADKAWGLFREWIDARWFAPSDLKRMTPESSPLRGIYIPYWTYDADAFSPYTGQRGDDYWETESYTTFVNGKTEHHTRQVRRTRWHYVSGSVQCHFDDVLVLASKSLPQEYAEKLEPWDLPSLVDYNDSYLSGFEAESYQIDLREGFHAAQSIMEERIRSAICADIGGDHQRIDSMDPVYSNLTFKHILLPIWLSAYRHHQKLYRFLINARTGEVQGERPYSVWKILALIVGIAGAVGAGVMLAKAFGR